jgi:hypothetical protein
MHTQKIIQHWLRLFPYNPSEVVILDISREIERLIPLGALCLLLVAGKYGFLDLEFYKQFFKSTFKFPTEIGDKVGGWSLPPSETYTSITKTAPELDALSTKKEEPEEITWGN